MPKGYWKVGTLRGRHAQYDPIDVELNVGWAHAVRAHAELFQKTADTKNVPTHLLVECGSRKIQGLIGKGVIGLLRPRVAINYATLYVRYSAHTRHLKFTINGD